MAENDPLKAGLGTHVEVELVAQTGETEVLAFDIVPDKFSDFSRGYLGESTPLAQAVRGHASGESVSYPVDDLQAVRILDIQPARSGPDQSVAVRREETLRKAAKQSDLASAIIFATSFNSKWGDYDPSRLSEEWEEES